ncbi:MAG: hypothetical protein ACRD0W_11445 [Acidimicrobiales bacterium]
MRRPRAHVVARWGTVLVGLACAGVGWLAAGTSGLLAALVAIPLVVGFFWSGVLPLALAGVGGLGAGVGLTVLLLTYTLRLALVLLALRLLQRVDALDPRWLGGTIVVCALAWSAVHLAVAIRAEKPQLAEPEIDDPSGRRAG